MPVMLPWPPPSAHRCWSPGSLSRMRTLRASWRRTRDTSTRTQPPDGPGQHGIKLRIPDWDCTEEETPVGSIAYHDEDRVIASDLQIGSINGDFTVDQPSAVTVDAEALAADVGSRRQV